jgi:hypothetical protein
VRGASRNIQPTGNLDPNTADHVSQKIPKEILMRHLVLAILAPGPLTPLIQVKGRTLSKQTRQDAVNAALGAMQ